MKSKSAALLHPSRRGVSCLNEGDVATETSSSKHSDYSSRSGKKGFKAPSSKSFSDAGNVYATQGDDDEDEQSRISKETTDLYRKVCFDIKQMQDFLVQCQMKSEERIKFHSGVCDLDSQIEDVRHKNISQMKSASTEYILEVDKVLEDKYQLTASKKYHLTMVSSLLPPWCKILMEASAIVQGIGHRNKTHWRSKAKTLLLSILSEMDNDVAITEDTRADLRNLIFRINTKSAQEMIHQIAEIKESYLKRLDKSSQLGFHKSEYDRICGELASYDNRVKIPLPRERWSPDLQDMASQISCIQNTCSLSNTIGVSSFSSSKFDYEIKAELKKLKSLDELPLNSLQVKLRMHASIGKFEDAWAIFDQLFHDHLVTSIISARKRQVTLQRAPTLADFKVLLLAVKNEYIVDHSQADFVLKNMAFCNIEPDVQFFNILIKSCERSGAWRKALRYFAMMQQRKLLPSSTTFAVLGACCRHSTDEPSMIYDGLRSEGLPIKFCRQVALCNCANRVSIQAATDSYNTFRPVDELSLTLSSLGTMSQHLGPAGVKFHNNFNLNWKAYRSASANFLPAISPAKNTNGLSSAPFNTRLKKIVHSKVKRLNEISVANNSTLDKMDSSDGFRTKESFGASNNNDKPFMHGVNLESSVHDDD